MPTYDYICTNCNKKSEIVQKITDSKITKCPFCNKNTFERMVSIPNFHLKGTGWYATDFKKSSKAKDKELEGSEASQPAKEDKKGNKTTKTSTDVEKNKPKQKSESS